MLLQYNFSKTCVWERYPPAAEKVWVTNYLGGQAALRTCENNIYNFQLPIYTSTLSKAYAIRPAFSSSSTEKREASSKNFSKAIHSFHVNLHYSLPSNNFPRYNQNPITGFKQVE